MQENLDDECFVVGEDSAEAQETLIEEVEGIKIDITHSLVEKLEGQRKLEANFVGYIGSSSINRSEGAVMETKKKCNIHPRIVA